MKMNAYIAGIGMTSFGNHLDTTLKVLAGQAIQAALNDAGMDRYMLQAAWMANAAASVIQGQVMIPGEVVLRNMGIGRIPVINVENACASGATAFQQASAMISAGLYDVALVCGSEKLFHEDRIRAMTAFAGAIDVEEPGGPLKILDKLAMTANEPIAEDVGVNRSVFMDIYSLMTKKHMKKYGSTKEHFAMVSVKNSFHGSLNPLAQFQKVLTVEEVLSARTIIEPLTLPMCSPICDGAAAVILVSERKARELGLRNPVRVMSSALATGWDWEKESDNVGALAANQAYEAAGIGPQEISCAELHDASAPSEIMAYEYLGLCRPGEGVGLIESGATRIGGRLPVNSSGGLLRKGHPVAATGCAQIVELTKQLQGRADGRQIERARIGMAHNAGGLIGIDAASTVVTILGREG